MSGLTLDFNASFDAALIDRFALRTPDGTRKPTDPNRNNSNKEASYRSVRFPGALPQNAELTVEIPSGLKDETGRPLANAASFPLKTRTGGLPPLAKFPGDFGIVELKQGGLLPVTLRNVETSLKTAGLTLPGSHRFCDPLGGIGDKEAGVFHVVVPCVADGIPHSVPVQLHAHHLLCPAAGGQTDGANATVGIQHHLFAGQAGGESLRRGVGAGTTATSGE